MSHRSSFRACVNATYSASGVDAEHLFRMRDKHDIPGRFERMDMMAQTDRAEHWDAHWGRKEGETNAERLERLGEREEDADGREGQEAGEGG